MSDYKIAIKIAAQLEKSFGSTIKSAQKSLSSFGTMGQITAAGIGAAGAALTAVGGYSINQGREFEAAMSSAAATSGANQEQFDKMRAAALEAGRTTSKTAAESANALEYMALAGWDVDTSTKALLPVLRMSEASGMDLARCSDLVTDSMAATGTGVDELGNYLDICTRAQNKSNTTAEQMMEAYIGVGGVMNNLNVPLTESGAALGVLANRGIKGSEAGTALNAIMTNLTTGTGQAGKMMASLGVSAFDSDGKFKGVEVTLQELNQALSGCTEEQRNAALAAIGGKHHVKDLNALMAGLNETNEDGVTEWDALSGELKNAGGALDEMASTKMDNLNGDLAIFESALSDAGIAIYDGLQGPLREAVQTGTQEIYKLSDAMRSGGFDAMVAEIGTVLADGVTMISTYAPKFVDMGTQLILSLLDGIDQNSAAIGGGAANTAAKLIEGILKVVPRLVSTGGQLLIYFIQGFSAQIPSLMAQAAAGAEQLAQGFIDNLPLMVQTGQQLLQNIGQGAVESLPTIIVAGAQAIGAFLQGAGEILPQLITTGVQVIGSVLVGLVQGLPYIIQGGLTLIVGLVQGIVQNLPTIVTTAITVIQYLVNTFVENLPQILTVGMLLLLELAQGIAENLPTIVTAGVQIIGQLISGIIQNLPTILVYGAQIIGTLASGIVQGIVALVQAIPGLFVQIGEAIMSIDWLEVGKQILEGIKAGFIAAWQGLVDMVTGLWEDFKNWFTGENTEYVQRDIAGYTETMDGRYTNDNGQTYYTAQQLADQGVAGAADVVKYDQQKANGQATDHDKQQAADEQSRKQYSAATQQAAEEWKPDFSKIYQAGQQGGQEYNDGLAQSIVAGAQQQADAMTQSQSGAATQSTQEMINQIMSQMNGAEGQLQQTGTQAGTSLGSGLQQSIGTALSSLGTGAGASVDTSSIMSGLTSGMTTEGTQAGQNLLQSFNQGTAGLQGAGTTAMDGLNTGVQTGAVQTQQTAATTGTNMVSAFSVLSPQMGQAGTAGMSSLNTGLAAGGATAQGTATSTRNSVISAFSGLSPQLHSSGVQAMSGFIGGMNAMAGSVAATAASIANSAKNAINSALQIHSPSRVLAQSGMFTGQGFINGLAAMRSDVQKAAASSLADPMMDMTAPDVATGFRTGVLHSVGQTAANGGQEAQPAETGAQFVYSPSYNFYGQTSKEDVAQVDKMSQAEFNRKMQEYMRQKSRVSFA